jgi:hypothetical protein
VAAPARIDRIQLATHDRRAAAATWRRLFGAELAREDRLPSLGCERSVLRIGESELELLEPDGVGAVAQHLSRSRSALFAVGVAVPDLERERSRLDARAVHHVVDGGQLHLTGEWLGVPGLRMVVSRDEAHAPVGLLLRVYEATHLMRGFARAAARLTEAFELDERCLVPIRSEPYGYEGLLVMLRPERLDRIETVTPFDPARPMGRFFARQGPGLYMFYAEARDTTAVRERILEHAPDAYTGPRQGPADNLFVHPRALDGALLGVSRETVAWRWSGRAERARPAAVATP